MPAEPDDSELAEEIARRLESIIPKGQQAQVVAQVVSIFEQERFSGPIAHPRHLREYENILPGSAERIIAMAESNLDHRQRMQDKAIQADIDDTRSGRNLGFAAFCLLIVCAMICVALGEIVAAGFFLGAAAIGAVGRFIDGRNKPSPED